MSHPSENLCRMLLSMCTGRSLSVRPLSTCWEGPTLTPAATQEHVGHSDVCCLPTPPRGHPAAALAAPGAPDTDTLAPECAG